MTSSHGWHVVRALERHRGRGFAYTIGLFKNYGHPEVIAFGLPPDRLHALLNLVGDEAKSGCRRSPGDISADFIDGYSCTFIEFPASAFRDYLGYVLWFYSDIHSRRYSLSGQTRPTAFPGMRALCRRVRDLQPMPGKSVDPEAQTIVGHTQNRIRCWVTETCIVLVSGARASPSYILAKVCEAIANLDATSFNWGGLG